MKLANRVVLKLLVILAIAATAKADDLVSQAWKYDSAYTPGPQTSQQKALELYQSALTTKLSKEQRLEVLFRMAQLNGCAYRASKGEKPDYQKAISLYEQIVNEYPTDDPKVQTAMNMISSHYTTLRQFEKSLEWAKKGFADEITNDVSQITQQYDGLLEQNKDFDFATSTPKERLAYRERVKQSNALRKVLDVKEHNQKAAVDLVAYSANFIDPLQAHGELRALISKYPNSVIEKRAAERLAENMEKMPELWAPQNLPIESSESAIQAYTPAPTASLSQREIGTKVEPSKIKPESKKEISLVESVNAEKSQTYDHIMESRASPYKYLVIVIVGLVILGLLTIMKKKNIFKEFNK